MQGVLHGTRCALGDIPEPSCHGAGALLVQGGDKELFKFICFSCCSRARKHCQSSTSRKVLLHFKQKAAALSSGSHRCCPHWSHWRLGHTPQQTSILPRTEQIPVYSRTPRAPRTHYRQQQVMGLQKEKGVSPADCSPGCRVPSWPFACLLSWSCESSLWVSTPQGQPRPHPAHTAEDRKHLPKELLSWRAAAQQGITSRGFGALSMGEQLTRVCCAW